MQSEYDEVLPQDLQELNALRQQGNIRLRDLIPLLRELQKKRKEQVETFTVIDKLLRSEGFSLYWDDYEQRFCIYPLPQMLDETSRENNTNPRDTQFAGFAKLLLKEVAETSCITYASWEDGVKAQELVIARRAYDLVKHAFSEVDSLTINYYEVPDMTEWPEEEDARLEHYANHQYDGVDFGEENEAE